MQLYGLTLVPRRRVSFGAIDPEAARDVFIREALVPGALATKGAFLAHNRKLVAEVAELEHKARRQDVLVDDDTIAAFYAERIPEGVHSLATFEHWRAGVERDDPTALLHDARDADAPRGGARDRGALSRPRSRWPAPCCRSSTASRRGSRETA